MHRKTKATRFCATRASAQTIAQKHSAFVSGDSGVITQHDQRLKAGSGTKRNRIDFRSDPKQVVRWLL
jgi:hypothetical protein